MYFGRLGGWTICFCSFSSVNDTWTPFSQSRVEIWLPLECCWRGERNGAIVILVQLHLRPLRSRLRFSPIDRYKGGLKKIRLWCWMNAAAWRPMVSIISFRTQLRLQTCYLKSKEVGVFVTGWRIGLRRLIITFFKIHSRSSGYLELRSSTEFFV